MRLVLVQSDVVEAVKREDVGGCCLRLCWFGPATRPVARVKLKHGNVWSVGVVFRRVAGGTRPAQYRPADVQRNKLKGWGTHRAGAAAPRRLVVLPSAVREAISGQQLGVMNLSSDEPYANARFKMVSPANTPRFKVSPSKGSARSNSL